MMTETFDAALSLLDRQILDADGRMIGKVDDVAIEQDADGRCYAAALLVGPGALGPRIGGLLGDWMTAVWRRLDSSRHPVPGAIPMGDVAEIGSAIRLNITRHDAQVEGFETWVRTMFVDRLPGAR